MLCDRQRIRQNIASMPLADSHPRHSGIEQHKIMAEPSRLQNPGEFARRYSQALKLRSLLANFN